MLAEKGLHGTAPERARLIDAYAGNPLALKIVAQIIADLFNGAIAPFLEQGAVVFGEVRELLAAQFNRLSPLEQSIMLWLVVLREPATLDELRALLGAPVSRAQLLEGMETLRRRSLIERGGRPGSFLLQAVLREYVTSRLTEGSEREARRGG